MSASHGSDDLPPGLEETEFIELTPEQESQAATDNSIPAQFSVTGPTNLGNRVELVSGTAPGLSSKTTTLLHTRLRMVCALLGIFYVIVIGWAFLNQGVNDSGEFGVLLKIALVRVLVLAGLLAWLYARPVYSQGTLRLIEVCLFSLLVFTWIYSNTRSMFFNASAGDTISLVQSEREASIGLLILIIVYGLFIPHHWRTTLRVVLCMALAPAVALMLFKIWHPDMIAAAAELLSLRNVSTTTVVMVIGAALATYSSAVFNSLRTEVHKARRFGQYQLIERIGGGGMGDVYLAEHALMKRPCAMKLIRPSAENDPLALARFEREVKTTARLTHPNTIEIYDYGRTDDGTFYYVMEHLPGMSLSDLLKGYGRMSAGRTIYLLRQVCSALQEAHEAGLVHRDLKPANLFVSERGGLCDFMKVLDFGIVKVADDPQLDQLTLDKSVSGTPLYMAPEQAVGDQGLDGRSDLYALGAVAYQMVAGRPPFSGDNPVAIMIEHSKTKVTSPSDYAPDIPPDLEQVILKCLEKQAEDRYASAVELETALAACAAANEWDATQAAIWWQERYSSIADSNDSSAGVS